MKNKWTKSLAEYHQPQESQVKVLFWVLTILFFGIVYYGRFRG